MSITKDRDRAPTNGNPFASACGNATPLPLLFALLAVIPLRAFSLEPGTGLDRAVTDIEARLAARVGVVVMDAASGDVWGHRADERFPLISTFKPLACAAVLERVDAGSERLDRRLHFDAADLVAELIRSAGEPS